MEQVSVSKLPKESADWVEKQEGNVIQFEKVQHTFLNEHTGEMYCCKCQVSEHTRPNSRMDFMRHMQQKDAFEKFSEQHLHGLVV